MKPALRKSVVVALAVVGAAEIKAVAAYIATR